MNLATSSFSLYPPGVFFFLIVVVVVVVFFSFFISYVIGFSFHEQM